MLILTIFIAGCLVGADTGLHLRRLIDQTHSEMDRWFPVLAALAPLVTGIAISQSILLALLNARPELVYIVSGPLLVIYGFVWFQNSVTEYRVNAAAAQSRPEGRSTLSAWKLTSVLLRIGLGMQMGLLLCAAGARDLVSLLAALLAALLVARAPFRFAQPRGAPSEVLRCVAGAALFAIGTGVVLQQVTQGEIPALPVTLILAFGLWPLGVLLFWRQSR
jgi:hypothetical protein